jgi:uncharacterized membrane protein YoaK (UPF0700 family)
MFRHIGETRTIGHNLKIASVLSFVAGIVNVAGFLSVQRLTTNVTGHFAFFIDDVFKFQFAEAFIFILYIFFFLLGSFISNLLIELMSRKRERYMYILPVSIEIIILFTIAVFGDFLKSESPDLIAFSLLFAMGLQNSLVTTISNAVVRTTHLTGIFTDLGIDLSQLFFYNSKDKKVKLYSSIKLRLRIISCFFIGGLVGGLFYSALQLSVLLIGCMALVIGLIYDNLQVTIILIRQKLVSKKSIPI